MFNLTPIFDFTKQFPETTWKFDISTEMTKVFNNMPINVRQQVPTNFRRKVQTYSLNATNAVLKRPSKDFNNPIRLKTISFLKNKSSVQLQIVVWANFRMIIW